jgi:CBS-domain-containing membrane protein
MNFLKFITSECFINDADPEPVLETERKLVGIVCTEDLLPVVLSAWNVDGG